MPVPVFVAFCVQFKESKASLPLKESTAPPNSASSTNLLSLQQNSCVQVIDKSIEKKWP